MYKLISTFVIAAFAIAPVACSNSAVCLYSGSTTSDGSQVASFTVSSTVTSLGAASNVMGCSLQLNDLIVKKDAGLLTGIFL